MEGYIELCGKNVPVSSTDFGLVQLCKSARSRDVESVLKYLRTVDVNLQKYKNELTTKGLTDALSAKFSDAGTLLLADKKIKYGITSNRTAIVQNNLGLLNELYGQLVEICKIGKILYGQTDKAKLKDYTFTQLMKQVRRTEKAEEQKPGETPAPEAE